ncbi:MAG TPA: hypothetical protein GX707_01450 [Epulopiscium sp.]|nr:hypothetical protein [Candidatus Epulonipiscium sp.]
MKKSITFSRTLSMILLGVALFSNRAEAGTLKSINQNNTNLVPLRTISEELGAKVGFDGASQKITVIYKDSTIVATVGSKNATTNGNNKELQAAPQVIKGTTYVPIRFIGEALGGAVDYQNGTLKITLDDQVKEWKLETTVTEPTSPKTPTSGSTFSSGTKTVAGKKITYVTINMNDSKVKVKTSTANNTVTQVQALKTLAAGAKVGVNGTYFAAYNGDTPLPDGTIISNGKVINITDIGSTIGFTADNKVLIDFVKTRVQGYINGEEGWFTYRVNRPTPDESANIIYTPEYGKDIPLASGWSAVVCVNGKVEKIVNQTRKVPNNGFIIVTTKPSRFSVGDSVNYKTTYETTHTKALEWEDVIYAISAGPSLRINGQKTGDPKNESFTEAKILTSSAQRTFIGVTNDNQLMIGTVSASVNQLKDIVAQLGLKSAMCLDGGASSGLYYNGGYLTSPGRNLSNSLNFYY